MVKRALTVVVKRALTVVVKRAAPPRAAGVEYEQVGPAVIERGRRAALWSNVLRRRSRNGGGRCVRLSASGG